MPNVTSASPEMLITPVTTRQASALGTKSPNPVVMIVVAVKLNFEAKPSGASVAASIPDSGMAAKTSAQPSQAHSTQALTTVEGHYRPGGAKQGALGPRGDPPARPATRSWRADASAGRRPRGWPRW